MTGRIARGLAAAAIATALLAGCGGDDDADDSAAAGDTPAAEGGGDAPAAGGGGGTMTLDGETVALDRALCLLSPQEAAAGGGEIEFTGQGTGTNGAGDEVLIDLSHYSDESMFAGDSVSVTVGDPFSDEAANYSLVGGEGAILMDGSTLSGQDVQMTGDDGTTPATVSFELN
ncbi:MAG: hypothetical protein RJQ03_05810 [Miltoncostaeaceae bacterium]